jgi:hypothetical protein
MISHLHIYQIAVLLLAVFMIAQGIVRFAKGTANQTLLKLLVRILVWGGMAIVALSPNFSFWMAEALGISGNINAVILTGFILVFLMIFKLLSAIERLEQQMTEVTRKEALKEIESIKQ